MPRGVYERKSAQGAGAPKTEARQGVNSPVPLVEPSFYRNKRVAVDSLAGAELKAYARSIGITQRDVDFLTEDRLRQNCKARIADSMGD